MIPKIIHYCWFGGKPLPKLESKCRDSWKKFLNEYEIKCWDESNFDLSQYPFAKEAYEKKKFAFVADVARLHALNAFGGVYLDTDVEILKPLDDLLGEKLVMGFETDRVIQTGVILSEHSNPIISQMLEYYKLKSGFDPITDGSVPNSALFADLFAQKGIPLDNIVYRDDEITLLPSEYLCPINQATQEICTTPNSYCIHYLAGSWLGKKDLYSRRLKSLIGKTFGYGLVETLRAIIRRQGS